MNTPIGVAEKRAQLDAAGKPWPVCECHAEPMHWYKDPRGKEGGNWRCAVRVREAQMARKRARGVAAFGSAEHRASLAQWGAENSQWKGESATSTRVHDWLRRNYPKSGVCEECGKEGKTDYAFRHHPEKYTRNREDYRELCRPCHLAFDEEVVQRAAKRHGRRFGRSRIRV